MFKTRLISGIVLVAAALILLIFGGIPLAVVCLGLSLIGMTELYRACGIMTGKKLNPLVIVSFICAIAWYAALFFGNEKTYLPVLIASLMAIMCVYVCSYPKYKSEDVISAYFGLIYVAVMLSFIFQTRQLESGKILCWLIILSAWGSDTFAYCTGMLIGKHKMAPVLSPKKSIEGAVGGVVGAAVLGVVYALVFGQPPIEYGIICIFGALISMVGDLAASAIKRNRGIKDYGTLIPGHGGVLDRFDSIIFTAPVIYYFAYFIL